MVENKNNVCEVCGSGNGYCGQCGNMCGWRGNNILRWILGIIIITWIFCIGMKFGEMKVFLQEEGYGRGGNVMFRATSMPMSAGWTEATPANFTVSTAGVPVTGPAGVLKVIKSN